MGKPEKPGLRLATTGKRLSSPSLGHRMKPKGLDAKWFAQRGRGRLGWREATPLTAWLQRLQKIHTVCL